jgi:enediyne biosynthesis protein E4
LRDVVKLRAKPFAAGLAICGILPFAWVARPTSARPGGSEMAGRFQFQHQQISYATAPFKVKRTVHKSLSSIESWISAVGAAVAINDIDGDGLPNDLCIVDPRTDEVTVAPVPGTPQRYHPFVLKPTAADSAIAPMGCLPGDFDEDGRVDLLVYYWGRSPVIFFNRAAAGGPLTADSFVPADLVSDGKRWYSNAAVLADLDGDGHADLVIGNYFADGAAILDVSDEHPQSLHSSMSHAFNGGKKHFFLSSAAGFREASPVFLNQDGSGMDDSRSNELLRGWTLALGAADLNNDLLPELYIANDFGPDRLLENLSSPGRLKFKLLAGRRTLFTPKSKVLGNDSFKGMGVAFADLNGDGRLDILVSNITDEYALEESNFAFISHCPSLEDKDGYACFTDESEKMRISRSGWAWDIKAADFDNSGSHQIVQATGFLNAPAFGHGTNRWPELHETAMGNDIFLKFPATWHAYHPGDALSDADRNRFFVRRPDGTYVDLSQQIGLLHDAPARGIAVADVDGDGRLDFAVANQWAASDFYRNVTPHAGSSLSLRLLMPKAASGRFSVEIPAIRPGDWPAATAEVTVVLRDGRRLIQQLDGGNGHSGKDAFELHFGLGKTTLSEKLPVHLRWRDRNGVIQTRQVYLLPGRYDVLLGA